MNKLIKIKITIAVVFLLFAGKVGYAQNSGELREGKVSYVTTQNVYVKFSSTDNIFPGDTLFTIENGQRIPSLIVKEISSISCVCVPVGAKTLSVGESLSASIKASTVVAKTETVTTPVANPVVAVQDSVKSPKGQKASPGQQIYGNVTVASYLNFSNKTANSQRMRYTVAFNAERIGNSGLSVETYLTFVHKLDQWSEIQSDVFNGLKIYNLSLNYKFNNHHQVWFGRKINPRISNVGAIDGLQYEFKFNSFSVGVVGGTRPDYRNYSFNANLAQFGGYLGHDLSGKNGSMQTTLAFMQQMNSGNTDRRRDWQSAAELQYQHTDIEGAFFEIGESLISRQNISNMHTSYQSSSTS